MCGEASRRRQCLYWPCLMSCCRARWRVLGLCRVKVETVKKVEAEEVSREAWLGPELASRPIRLTSCGCLQSML